MRLKKVLYCLFFLMFFSACVSYFDNNMLGNMEYKMGNEHMVNIAKLHNGKYADPGWLYVSYNGLHVWGDFNHDGLQDAATIIVENTGGNSEWYQLAFLINDGKKLVHQSTYELDDRAIINSIVEKNGKVIVDMYIHQKGDCRAGPTKRVVNVYEYKGPDKWGRIEK